MYWHVRDTLPQPQYNPLDVIEAEVRGLVAKLEGEEEPPCSTSEGKGCA
ncbi:MAG: hypothetical protein KatS3mg131_3858 [Candidatus Tectimicrobiota bacterium]|nr:MAG: hypothetical protein KatS3mg131_3858 [Candidatus Tectomicrobia bacterium]